MGFPRGGGVAIGGGAGILGLVVFILLQLLGSSGTATSGALPGIDQIQGESTQLASECKTGADANTKPDCRVVAVVNSVQEFWTAEFQRRGAQYQLAPTTLFTAASRPAAARPAPMSAPSTARGTPPSTSTSASTATSRPGSGPRAARSPRRTCWRMSTGTTCRTSPARWSGSATADREQSGAVRLELQADCYAGLSANHATTEPGPDGGDPLVERITEEDIADGLDAAAAIGDDTIQKRFQGQVNPETWTHGSSAQRVKWFTTGYRTGDLDQCNTFRGSV